MFEIAGAIIIAAITIAAFRNAAKYLERRKLKRREFNIAAAELQRMQEFVANEERVKRWKVVQFKCQFFANAYNDDKNSDVPEIANGADKKLEEWISRRLDDAFAINDDEYCKSSSLHSIAEFLANVGQFERAYTLIEMIQVVTIKKRALERINELKIRHPSGA